MCGTFFRLSSSRGKYPLFKWLLRVLVGLPVAQGSGGRGMDMVGNDHHGDDDGGDDGDDDDDEDEDMMMIWT
jgi:hypothetical protein